MFHEYQYQNYFFSCDKNKIDLQSVHSFLSGESYWAKGIPEETVRRSIENSVCFGVYYRNRQIGFARVITDHATFAYLADVYILPSHRGKGLSKELMRFIMEYAEQLHLRRFMLATLDAHSLYTQYGFTSLKNPERMMEISRPGIYSENGLKDS
jgi:GNAT superfamily N-acetyltransferase